MNVADQVYVEEIILDHGLPLDMVRTLIQIESSWNQWAWNPEPRWRWFWNVRDRRPFRAITSMERDSQKPPDDFPMLAGDRDQEWWAQQASWGLMQIMGAVARESGFDGKYLPEILDPEENVVLGCRYLDKLKRRHHEEFGWRGVLMAYNTGSPKDSLSGRMYLSKFVAAGYKFNE